MATAQQVKELREKTGAGMMDCKKALVQCNDDMEKAIEFLREKGLASASKKAGRIAAEGIVESYIHLGGKIGVLVEVNCETDFVAKNEDFRAFVKDIAMHIAASNPLYLNEGKPEKIVDKMVEGRIKKYYSEICLLDQPFVKDPDKTIQQLVNEQISTIGENVKIRRFARFQMGEGLEKKEENFAEEVAKQMGN